MTGDYGGSYGGGAVTGGPGPIPGTMAMAGPGSASATGEITATLTWDDGNDYVVIPPPQAIVIKETCSVSWSGSSGSCTNPLGHSHNPDPAGYGDSSSGDKYWIKMNPPSTFDLHITPTANVSFSQGTPPDMVAGSCSVSYSAAAYPLEIVLGGGAGPSYLKKYLIGQELSGSLTTPLTPVPTSFVWSVSGGEPFDGYIVGPNDQANSPAGDYSYLDSVFPLNQPTVACNFKVQGTATVNLTCHLNVPTGALPAGGLDCNLSRTATVLRPDSIQLGVQIGSVTPFWNNPRETGYVQLTRLAAPPGSGNTEGMRFDGYVSYNTTDFGTGGKWGVVQLITPNDQRKSGSTWQTLHQTYPAPTGTVSINGLQCLDNSYPYAYWFNANVWDYQADSPGEPMEAAPIMAKDLIDSFQDTMMFIPPGGGSEPVPVKNWGWFWEFHDTRTGTLWNDPLTGANAQWGFGADFPAFPIWTRRLVNSWLVYQ
jgi:hypothetical protein